MSRFFGAELIGSEGGHVSEPLELTFPFVPGEQIEGVLLFSDDFIRFQCENRVQANSFVVPAVLNRSQTRNVKRSEIISADP